MEIYISRDRQRFGPYALSDVQADLDTGNVVGTDLAWHQSASGWIPVSQISGLIIPRRRVPPPPPASYASTPQKSSSGGELGLIIILSLLIPLIGLVVGII